MFTVIAVQGTAQRFQGDRSGCDVVVVVVGCVVAERSTWKGDSFSDRLSGDRRVRQSEGSNS